MIAVLGQIMRAPIQLQECVASLIGLYKNNGAVSCVGIDDFHLIKSLYHARTQLVVVRFTQNKKQ